MKRVEKLAKGELERCWPELLCLVPVYAPDGTNGTAVYLENRPPLFASLRTETLVKMLARLFCVDLKVARKRYSEASKRKYNPPLFLRPGLVLVPVRARQARAKDDKTRAYLVKAKIASLSEEGKPPKTRIVFVDGTSLEVLQRAASIRVLLAQAELVEQEGLSLLGAHGCSCPVVMEGIPRYPLASAGSLPLKR